MKKKIFGFDLGIASIGWAVVEFDNEFFNPETGEVIEGKIIKSGVRRFPVAENAKDGSSLAAPRREKRLARRICRRKARRMQGIKKLFVALNLVPNLKELENIYATQIGGDVWNLRIKALSEKLSAPELVRVLTHLAKHRGFKSYRKALEEQDAEGGKILQAIKENKLLLAENKTLAQVIVERAGSHGKKRNFTARDAKGNFQACYNNSIPRSEIERELDLIYQNQKQYGIFSEKLYLDFKNIAFRFRHAGSVADMVGSCTFEKGEKRAPKEAPSSEFFVALGKINNLAVYQNNQKRFLTPEEKNALFELLKNTAKVKYQTITKKIFPQQEIQFADINYNQTAKKAKDGSIKVINPEDALFYEMKGWHKLKSLFTKEEWDEISKDILLLDKIVTVIACEKNDESIGKELKKLNLSDESIEKLSSLTTDKFINLSLKALYKIIPFMAQGLKYNEACEKAGYDFKDNVNKLVEKRGILLDVIPAEKQTKIPVVNRTVAQFRKVYNAMVRQFGAPDQINIETGRELKKNYDERKKIIAQNKENEQDRLEAREKLLKINLTGNAKNILKYRLYLEQDGKCIYSGKALDLNRLDEEGYLDVDHIIPYSRSLDDSFNNKVLCLSSENRMKGNRTPFEYISKEEDWDNFVARVNLIRNNRKKENLLNKNFADRELEFRERNANDNNYISRYIKQYLEDGLDFSSSNCSDIKNRVQMRTGSLTAYLRHCWGLTKNRDENDRHHAQDAIVIACATQGMVKYLSTISGLWENKWEIAKSKNNGEAWFKSLKHKFSEPWSGFRNDVENSLNDVFVSRPPRKSATGSAHKDTIEKTSQNVSRLPIRNGEAIKENMFRCDVYKTVEGYKIVPIYVADLVNKKFKHYFQPYEEINGNKVEAEPSDFLFSLYKDDYIEIDVENNEKFKGYFNQYNAQSGQIYLGSVDNSMIFKIRDKKEDCGFHFDKEKKISLSKCITIKKYTISALGDKILVKKEAKRFFNNIKSNAQRLQERKLKKG